MSGLARPEAAARLDNVSINSSATTHDSHVCVCVGEMLGFEVWSSRES